MIEMTSVDFGSVNLTTPSPSAASSSEALPPEALAAFASAMEAPLQRNAEAQVDFELAVKAFAESSAFVKAPECASVAKTVPDCGIAPGAFAPDAAAPRNPSAAGASPAAQGAMTVAVETPVAEVAVKEPVAVAAETPPEVAQAVPQGELRRPEAVRSSDVQTTAPNVEPSLDASADSERIAASRPPVVAEKATPETFKAVVAENRTIAKTLEETLPQEAVASLLQGAVPVAKEAEAPVVQPSDQAVAAVSARAVETVARVERATSVSEMLVAAATEVAETVRVTPGLRSGEGEVVIRLKPDVLDGSAVRIQAAGQRLDIEFAPALYDTEAFIARHLPQLQQHLASRIHAYSIGVSVRKGRDERA